MNGLLYCSDFWMEKASFIIFVVRKHKTQKYTKMREYRLPKPAAELFRLWMQIRGPSSKWFPNAGKHSFINPQNKLAFDSKRFSDYCHREFQSICGHDLAAMKLRRMAAVGMLTSVARMYSGASQFGQNSEPTFRILRCSLAAKMFQIS